MASFQDAAWLRRLWSLAIPGDPVAQYVSNVHLVNDRSYASSRERAPFAMHTALQVAAGAGSQNFVELGSTDPVGVENLLHRAVLEVGMSNVLTGLASWVIAPTASLTTATRVAVTPMARDADPDVTPFLFQGTLTNANVPATANVIPRINGVGQTAATPSFQTGVATIERAGPLPFGLRWPAGSSLFFFSGDNQLWIYSLQWQGVRG